MSGGTPSRTGRSALTEEAGPVRRWLVRYFRRRVRDEADVEDMVQDVFTRMAARDSEASVDHLGGYVLKTASSVLSDWGRRGAARGAGRHVAFDADMHGEEDLDPERILSGREDLNAAIAVLLQLPERTRTVFILRRLDGESFRDIAAQLGISISAVEKHMIRAVKTLGLEMEKRRGS